MRSEQLACRVKALLGCLNESKAGYTVEICEHSDPTGHSNVLLPVLYGLGLGLAWRSRPTLGLISSPVRSFLTVRVGSVIDSILSWAKTTLPPMIRSRSSLSCSA